MKMRPKDILDRNILRSKIVLHGLTTKDMCKMLSLSENSYYNKLNGKRGFTEEELCVLFDVFGKAIFFPKVCYEKRKKRKEEKNDN